MAVVNSGAVREPRMYREIFHSSSNMILQIKSDIVTLTFKISHIIIIRMGIVSQTCVPFKNPFPR